MLAKGAKNAPYTTGRTVLAWGLLVMGLAVFLFQPPQFLPVANAACSGQNLYLGSYYIMPDDGSHPDFEQPLQPPQDVQGQLQTNLVNGLPVPTSPNPPIGSVVSIRQFDWYTPQYGVFTRLDNNPIAFSNDGRANTSPYFGPSTQPAESAALPANKDLFATHWHANLVAPPSGLSIPYSFALDDAGWVYLDGVLQIDHGGIHPPQTFTGNFTIPGGQHVVDIFYADRHTVNAVTNFQLGNLGALVACGSPNLSVVKSVQPNTLVNPGDLLTYTIQVANTGNFTATNTLIRDTTPANTSLVSATPAPLSGPAVGGQGELVWNVGTLLPGQQTSVTFVVQVNANTPPAVAISNAAQATSQESGGIVFKSNGVSNIVQASANLAVNKVANPPAGSTVKIGDQITYSIVVTNTGNVATGSLVVDDPLPTGTSFVSANPAPQSTNGTVHWVLPPLDPNTSRTLTLVVKVINQPNGKILQNRASASSNGVVAGSPLVTHNVADAADLGLNKLVDNTPITAGAVLTYHLQASNAGPSTATGVVVSDTLPAAFTLVSSTPTATVTGSLLTWNFPTLAPGATAYITYSVLVTNTYVTGTLITNTAQVGSNLPDVNPLNNSSSATVPGNNAPNDVQVIKSGPPKVAPGETFIYTLLVSTTLGGDNIVVTDTLPAGLVLVPDQTTPTPLSAGGSTYYWIIGHLNPNSQTTIQLAVKPSGTAAPGTLYNNTALVQSGTGPTRSSSSSNSANTSVVQGSNLSISKASTNDTFKPGSNLNFTINVKNNASTASGAVTITDQLLPGLVPQSATPPWTGLINNSDGSITVYWTVASVQASGATALNLTVLVPANYTGQTVSNAASLNTDTPNQDPNITSAPVVVPRYDLGAFLSLDKNTTVAALKKGQVFAYTIVVTNTGPIEAKNVVIQDPLPSGLTYVSAQPAPAATNPLSWNVGTLPPNGGKATITLLVQLAQDFTGQSISNRASVSSLTTNNNQPNNYSVKNLPIAAPPASATPALTAIVSQATATATSSSGGSTTAATTSSATGSASTATAASLTAAVTTTGSGGGGTGTTVSAGSAGGSAATATATATAGMPNAGRADVQEATWQPLELLRFGLGLLLVGLGIWLLVTRRRGGSRPGQNQ